MRLTQPHKPRQPATSRHLPFRFTRFLYASFPLTTVRYRFLVRSEHHTCVDGARACKGPHSHHDDHDKNDKKDTITACLTLTASASDRANLQERWQVLLHQGGRRASKGSAT